MCGLATWLACIVGLRVLWGFIGPERARFQDFVVARDRSRYLVDLWRGRARRYLGHSPAGGAMVVLLLLSLAATGRHRPRSLTASAAKGLLAESGTSLVAAAYADEDETAQRRGLRKMRRNGDMARARLASCTAHSPTSRWRW